MKLHTKLFIALVAGIGLGAALHSQADSALINAVNTNLLRPIGQIFLRSIFMIVVPMVFSALVIGVYDLGRGRDLSGVAGRTLWFTVVMSTLSVVIGMLLVNVLRPGENAALQQAIAAQPSAAVQALRPTRRRASRWPTRSSSSCPETRSIRRSARWTARCCR